MKTKTMTRTKDWRYLTPDDLADVRRALRWRWVPTALWLLVALLAVAIMVAVCWPEALVWLEEWIAECGVRSAECNTAPLMLGAVAAPDSLWPVALVCGGVTLLVWAAGRKMRKAECGVRSEKTGGRVVPTRVCAPPPPPWVESFSEFEVGPLESLGEFSPDEPVPFEVVESAAAEDCLAGDAAGLTAKEVERILRCVAAEIRLVTNMVASARHTLSVEDYGDSLDGAERRLRQMRVTCVELAGRIEECGVRSDEMRNDEMRNRESVEHSEFRIPHSPFQSPNSALSTGGAA